MQLPNDFLLFEALFQFLIRIIDIVFQETAPDKVRL
jgi:hypothetical protein